jgi:hypothetical protein
MQVDVHRIDVVADFDVVPDVADTGESGHRLCGGGARSALERFLQLAGEFVGRDLHRALHDLGGLGQRLVESLSMVGSPTAMSPAWPAVSCSAAS